MHQRREEKDQRQPTEGQDECVARLCDREGGGAAGEVAENELHACIGGALERFYAVTDRLEDEPSHGQLEQHKSDCELDGEADGDQPQQLARRQVPPVF